MANRIKLTSSFQDLSQVIENYSALTTYRIQCQGDSIFEFVDNSSSTPSIQTNSALDTDVSRLVACDGDYITYKQGTNQCWARVISDNKDCYISVMEVS